MVRISSSNSSSTAKCRPPMVRIAVNTGSVTDAPSRSARAMVV
jgi:hypothetical protein